MTLARLVALVAALVAALAIGAGVSRAQTSEAVASWIAVSAPPGHEAASARALGTMLPGWSADAWGNLSRRTGSGVPRRVVACAMDYSAYVVSQVTERGYLRLRRTGTPTYPLWDQAQEAQRVTVFTARARVSGVVAVANGHFARQHRGDTAVVGVDDLWVDVGASSPGDVAKLGIQLLDAVAPDRPQWSFGAYATGPAAGLRAGCAAVAAAARATPTSGETTYILSTQHIFGWVGLAAALARMGRIDALAIADEGQAVRSAGRVRDSLPTRMRALRGRVAPESVELFAPAVRWAGSTVETVDSTEARALAAWMGSMAGIATAPQLTRLPLDTARRLAPRTDAYRALEERFMRLADLPGVTGHEARVRELVLAELPVWARAIAQVDTAGNVIVAAGRGTDTIAILAHMDEVGFEVDSIRASGRITLRARGGVVLTSWEGVPALLHLGTGNAGAVTAPLRGVFVPRDSARTKAPVALTAWFGMDSAALIAAGVRPGMQVTAYKRAARLGGTRITGRSSDDRTGSTALLAAINAIDPATLPRIVYFVWTVREEGGLFGARAFGNAYGRSLRRVYSIDTFVSSDTPLESPHFAFAPLGGGAVIRGLDDASLPPREERDRVLAIARARGIPLQVGTTQGGTDGSAISPWGPSNVGLSWPGRYSHGPAEVLDLRDVHALARLVRAVALSR